MTRVHLLLGEWARGSHVAVVVWLCGRMEEDGQDEDAAGSRAGARDNPQLHAEWFRQRAGESLESLDDIRGIVREHLR